MVEDALMVFVKHATMGVYRPGSWERKWLVECFGEHWQTHLVAGDRSLRERAQARGTNLSAAEPGVPGATFKGMSDQFNVPDLRFPEGIDIDASEGKTPACKVSLPYPAKRCGWFYVECRKCHVNVLITTAGRIDDPRSVCLPCYGRTKPV